MVQLLNSSDALGRLRPKDTPGGKVTTAVTLPRRLCPPSEKRLHFIVDSAERAGLLLAFCTQLDGAVGRSSERHGLDFIVNTQRGSGRDVLYLSLNVPPSVPVMASFRCEPDLPILRNLSRRQRNDSCRSVPVLFGGKLRTVSRSAKLPWNVMVNEVRLARSGDQRGIAASQDAYRVSAAGCGDGVGRAWPSRKGNVCRVVMVRADGHRDVAAVAFLLNVRGWTSVANDAGSDAGRHRSGPNRCELES